MGIVALLFLSIGVQIVAAAVALRLIPLTGRRWAWILIATALSLMAVRRSVTLWHILSAPGTGTTPPASTEVIALMISVLMAVGVILILPVFRSADEAQRRSLESEARFRDMVESTSDWIWEVNEKPVFTYCSPRSRELLGYEPEELVGRHPHSLMPPRERERAGAVFEKLMEARQPFVHVKNVNLHKDGREVVLETSGVPIFDQGGLFRGYRGIDRDITDRERAERALSRLNRALQVAMRCNERIIHAHGEQELQESVCRVLVETGGFRFAWVGVPREDPERTVRPLAIWGDDQGYLDTVRVSWGDSALGQGPAGRAVRSGEPSVVRHIRTDPSFGPWREAALRRGFESCAALPLLHEGTLYGVMAIYSGERDAFDPNEIELLRRVAGNLAYGVHALRVREERESLATRIQHKQRVEAVGELTAGIAHDFNNLLTVIQANAELLTHSFAAGDEEAFREHFDELRGAAASASDMVRKLLAFGRADTVVARPVDLVELVAGQIPLLRRLLSEEIDVAFSHTVERAPLVADPGAVEQILTNLVTNARDAMPSGGEIRVEVAHQRLQQEDALVEGPVEPGSYLCLTVRDTGTGMDEETRRRVFDPFFTTKSAGRGTGLGLSVTYGLVRQHGGFIRVYSEVGRGTVMKVYFPCAEDGVVAAGTDVGIAGVAGPTVAGEVVGGSETILVVDDDANLRRAARLALERYGYTVVPAEDGQIAIELLRGGEPPVDLVVADAVMPRMGGPELHRTLREEGRDIPFLLMSGYAERDFQGVGDSSSEMLFLKKPWTIEELVRTVRWVLDGDTAEPEASRGR